MSEQSAITDRSVNVLLGERDGHTKALAAINAELERRAKELEAAIGKPKRERAKRSDKGTTRGNDKAATKAQVTA